jgi:hypothetical protein
MKCRMEITSEEAKELGLTAVRKTWRVYTREVAYEVFSKLSMSFREYFKCYTAEEYWIFTHDNIIRNNKNSPSLISENDDGSINQHNFQYYMEINSLADLLHITRILGHSIEFAENFIGSLSRE